MPAQELRYYQRAASDAADLVEHFQGEIIVWLEEGGKASDNLNDYAGGVNHHHQSHVDKSYTLLEAANVLEELRPHEELNESLWEGQSLRDALSTQAGYTYGHAVYYYWSKLIKKINEEFKARHLKPRAQDWTPKAGKGKPRTLLALIQEEVYDFRLDWELIRSRRSR